MTKNSGKGGKKHKRMKNESENIAELVFKEDGQDYALVTDILGHGRCYTKSYFDDISRLSVIRGAMRKKSKYFIRRGDVVLISLRDYQDEKADIIHLYTEQDVRNLKTYKEIEDKEEEYMNVEFGEISIDTL
jgi:translation initiation factor 1A